MPRPNGNMVIAGVPAPNTAGPAANSADSSALFGSANSGWPTSLSQPGVSNNSLNPFEILLSRRVLSTVK
jgi:hypothetical protein